MKKCICAILGILFCFSVSAQQTDTVKTVEKVSLTDKVIHWYNDHLNYGTITLLMTVESSFIPFPSEVIVPPAAYQACNEENTTLYVTDSKGLNILFVVLFATLGSLLGATLNYVLSMLLGRPIIYWFADSKVGHLLLLSSQKVKKAEDYFIENGKSSTLIGRFIPAIRQLISIPAGLAKMNFGIFLLFTSIGASLWNVILALLGYVAHGQKDLIDQYNDELKVALWILCAGFVIYLVVKGVRGSRAKGSAPTEGSSETAVE